MCCISIMNQNKYLQIAKATIESKTSTLNQHGFVFLKVEAMVIVTLDMLEINVIGDSTAIRKLIGMK